MEVFTGSVVSFGAAPSRTDEGIWLSGGRDHLVKLLGWCGCVQERGGHGDKLGDNGSSFSVTGQVLWQQPLKPPCLTGCGAECCGRFWGRWGDGERKGEWLQGPLWIPACASGLIWGYNRYGSKTKPSGNQFYPLSFCKHPGALFNPVRKQETASGEGQQERSPEEYSSEHSEPCSISARDADPPPCWGMSSDSLSNEMSSCSSRKIRPCA